MLCSCSYYARNRQKAPVHFFSHICAVLWTIQITPAIKVRDMPPLAIEHLFHDHTVTEKGSGPNQNKRYLPGSWNK